MPSFNTRRDDRDSLFFIADLQLEEGQSKSQAKLRNLSASGAMFESTAGAKEGSRVSVQLHNLGPIPGTIVWVRGKRIGMTFDEQINAKSVRMKVEGGDTEAPIYARSALSAPRHDGWNGKLRRI